MEGEEKDSQYRALQLGIRQRWAKTRPHTFDSDLRFLPSRSPTSLTLFFQGKIESQRLLPSIFCKVGVDGAMFFNTDSVKVDPSLRDRQKSTSQARFSKKNDDLYPSSNFSLFPKILCLNDGARQASTSTPTDPHPPVPLSIHIECFTSRWGGGGGPWDGLTRSGATSGRIERGALDNDSEATEGTVQCTYLYSLSLSLFTTFKKYSCQQRIYVTIYSIYTYTDMRVSLCLAN
jgi:hypothetical protein